MPPGSSPSPSSRGEHSIPFDHSPRILRRCDLHAVGHRRADRGQRDQVADGHVERAAADLQRLAVAGIDVDQLDPVGVGVRPQVSSTRATTMPSSSAPSGRAPRPASAEIARAASPSAAGVASSIGANSRNQDSSTFMRT